MPLEPGSNIRNNCGGNFNVSKGSDLSGTLDEGIGLRKYLSSISYGADICRDKDVYFVFVFRVGGAGMQEMI